MEEEEEEEEDKPRKIKRREIRVCSVQFCPVGDTVKAMVDAKTRLPSPHRRLQRKKLLFLGCSVIFTP